jgi:hypothetical protein
MKGNTVKGQSQPTLASVRPNEPCEPGGHLSGDRALVRVGALPSHGRLLPPRSAVALVELGPCPGHPRGLRCRGDGECPWCLAAEHWGRLRAIVRACRREGR